MDKDKAISSSGENDNKESPFSMDDVTAPDFQTVSELMEWYEKKDQEALGLLPGRDKKSARRRFRNLLKEEMERKRKILEGGGQAAQSVTSSQCDKAAEPELGSGMFNVKCKEGPQPVAPSVPAQRMHSQSDTVTVEQTTKPDPTPKEPKVKHVEPEAEPEEMLCPLCKDSFTSAADLQKHYRTAKPNTPHFQLYNCVKLALGETFEEAFPTVLPPDCVIPNSASDDLLAATGKKRTPTVPYTKLTFQQGAPLKLTSIQHVEGRPLYYCRICDVALKDFKTFMTTHITSPAHKWIYRHCRYLVKGNSIPQRFDFIFSDVPPGTAKYDGALAGDDFTMMVDSISKLPAVDRKLLCVGNLPANMGEDHLIALLLDYHPEKFIKIERSDDHWSAVVEMESENYAVSAMVHLDYKCFFRGSDWRIYARLADKLDLKEKVKEADDLKPLSEVNGALKALCDFPYYHMKSTALKEYAAVLEEKSENGKISLSESILTFMKEEPFVFVRSNFSATYMGQFSNVVEEEIYRNNLLTLVLRELVSHLECTHEAMTEFMKNFKKKIMATREFKRGHAANHRDLLLLMHTQCADINLKSATLSKFKLPKVDRNRLYVSGLPMSALEVKKFLENHAKGVIQEMILLEKGDHTLKHVMIRVNNPFCKQNLSRSLNNVTLPGCGKPVKVKIFEKWDEMPLPSIEGFILPSKPHVQATSAAGYSAIYPRANEMVSIPGLDSVNSCMHEEIEKDLLASKKKEKVGEKLHVKNKYPKAALSDDYDIYHKVVDRYPKTTDRVNMVDRGESGHRDNFLPGLGTDDDYEDLYGDSSGSPSSDKRGLNEDQKSDIHLHAMYQRSRWESPEPEPSQLIANKVSVSPPYSHQGYRESSPFRSKSQNEVSKPKHRDHKSTRQTYASSHYRDQDRRRSRTDQVRVKDTDRRSPSPYERRSRSPVHGMRSGSPYRDRSKKHSKTFRDHKFLSHQVNDSRSVSLRSPRHSPPRKSDHSVSKHKAYPVKNKSPYGDRETFKKGDDAGVSSSYKASVREDRSPVIRCRWDSSPDRDADFVEKRVINVFPKQSETAKYDSDLSISFQRQKSYDPSSPTLSAGHDQSSVEEHESRVIESGTNQSPREELDRSSDTTEVFDSLYERLQRYEKLYEERTLGNQDIFEEEYVERKEYSEEVVISDSYRRPVSENIDERRTDRSVSGDRISRESHEHGKKKKTGPGKVKIVKDGGKSGERKQEKQSVESKEKVKSKGISEVKRSKESSGSKESSRRDRRSRSRERHSRSRSRDGSYRRKRHRSRSRSYEERSSRRRRYRSSRYSRSSSSDSYSSESSFSSDLSLSPDRRLLYPLRSKDKYRHFRQSRRSALRRTPSDPFSTQLPPAQWPGNPEQKFSLDSRMPGINLSVPPPTISSISVTNHFTSTTNQFTAAASQFSSPTGQFTPATNQFTPVTNQFTPATNQFTPVTNQFTPVTNQFTPVTNQFTPVTNQFKPASGFPPSGFQSAPPQMRAPVPMPPFSNMPPGMNPTVPPPMGPPFGPRHSFRPPTGPFPFPGPPGMRPPMRQQLGPNPAFIAPPRGPPPGPNMRFGPPPMNSPHAPPVPYAPSSMGPSPPEPSPPEEKPAEQESAAAAKKFQRGRNASNLTAVN